MSNSQISHQSPFAARCAVRLPREGLIWLLATAFMLAIGLFKVINLLALLGCLLLVVWVLNALLAGRGLRHLRGQRWLGGPIFAQTPFTVTLEMMNQAPKAIMGIHLEDQGPGHALSRFVPALASRETLRCSEEVVLPVRGRYAWEAFRAVSGYPFGLVRRQVLLAPATEVIVLPRLGQLQRGRLRRWLPPLGLTRDRVRHEARRHATAQSEFHGLRSFRSGDSPRWIHWRTSARRGELMVREFEDVPTEDLIIVFDPGANAEAWADLETALSLTATIVWEWCRHKGDRLVLAVAGSRPLVLDGHTGPSHAQRLLECLAVVTAEPPVADLTALLELLEARKVPATPLLVVSARPGDLAAQLSRRLQRPAAAVAASALAGIDFYEGPPPS